MSVRNAVVVVGSGNVDMVAHVERFPNPGETIFGSSFQLFPGGKGANQAVCAARLGSKVTFVGKVGKDVLADRLVASLQHEKIDLTHVTVDPVHATGTALISVDATGQNQIIVVSGSNMAISRRDLARSQRSIARATVLLTQLEVPLPIVEESLRQAKRGGLITILNPAPARALSSRIMRLVDVLTPNENEAEILTGVRVNGTTGAVRAGRILLKRGVGHVIVTMGRRGCVSVGRDHVRSYPSLRVRAVDTTAAGDAFNGAMANGLALGWDVDRSIRHAIRASAFSVTRKGAIPSMPTARMLKSWRPA